VTPLGRRTWPELAAVRPVLAVPLGSCEQHGPHLPLDTDTTIAVALASELARRRDDVAVAPPLAYGASGEHAGFPGTLSIGLAALEVVLVELVRSADAFAGVVLVNGHGGNARAVEHAMATSRREGRRVLSWWPSVEGGDAHAGRVETSVMLALDPEAVHPDRAEPGRTEPLAELLPALQAEGVRPVSPSGVLGDPTGATAAEGRRLLDELAGALVAAVDAWRA
jgi:creatinine amidohydrolase